MEKRDNTFLQKLLATFRVEAEERMEKISSYLIALEKQRPPEKTETIIEEIYREFHSLKGASRAVNLEEVEKICQSVESVFALIKEGKISLAPQVIKLLFNVVDLIQGQLLKTSQLNQATQEYSITDIIHQLESISKGEIFESITDTQQIKETKIETRQDNRILSDTVRISVDRLNSILLQAEEMIPSAMSVKQSVIELKDISNEINLVERQLRKWQSLPQTSREAANKKNYNGNFSDTVQQEIFREEDEAIAQLGVTIKSIENKMSTLTKRNSRESYLIQSRLNNLLDDVKNTLMLPFSSFLDQYHGVVRKLSGEQGKEAELVINGKMIEVDRRILEEINTPLLHLIRNSIDHGIEKPEERKSKGKSVKGIISFRTQHKEGNKFEILISDDGAGIKIEKVKSAALRLGIVSEESIRKMGEKEILNLIFQSGISTSPIITDISGRGLGLAIVKSAVEKLNGTIALETNPDSGTTFRITLPVKLANFLGILVSINNHQFVFPASGVERVMKIKKEMKSSVENKETIKVEGLIIPLIKLNDVMNIPHNRKKGISDERYAVIINSGDIHIAFLVDEVLSGQEILVKNLTKPLYRVKNIMGASTLVSGEIVPIINLQDLIKSAAQLKTSGGIVQKSETKEGTEKEKKSILLVEDSITARALLKNILDAAGYNVKTAVDGADAFTKLKTDNFDIVVSDVEMPRMNGFDLTSKIRSDKKLTDMPVVLVTALESREDREKGIDAGANAYIVKSSFDQSNLLEVIERLI